MNKITRRIARAMLPYLTGSLLLAGIPSAIAQTQTPDTQALQSLTGTWHCAGHFVSNGASISSTIAFEWNEAAHALLVHHDDTAPNSYHAIELWAASKEAGEYRNSIVDAYSGMRWFTSPGLAGTALSWTRMDQGQAKERFVYSRTGPASMTVDWLVAKDHVNLVLGDTLECQRA